ncbi:MAG: sugar phosphate isomerase/epimerase family protein [Anaerolineae bacterium]
MQPCINEATTMSTDFPTDVRAYAEAGFESMELWLPKVEQFIGAGGSLEAAARLLQQAGVRAVAACAQGGILLSDGEARRQALAQLRDRAGATRALGADTIIVYSESAEQVDEDTYSRAARNLAEACDLVADFGVTIALEFIKGSHLVGSLPTARRVVAEAGRANLGVLFDTFHFYAGVSKMEDLIACDGADLAFVHVNDAADRPREILTDADRVLTGEGVFPVREMLRIIRDKGYEGYCSLELFNRELWDTDPWEVARRAHASLTEFLAGL